MDKFLAQRAVVTADEVVNSDDGGSDVADVATHEVVSKKRKMYKRLYDDKYLAVMDLQL